MSHLRTASSLLRVLRQWLPQLAHFLSLQAAGQLLGFLTGLIAVRLLAVEGFGKYSISLALQGTAVILADIGVGSALSALGARVCEDPRRFGELIASALAFRRRLEVAALVISEPLLLFLLIRAGATRKEAAIAGACLAIAVHGQVTIGVYSIVPLLKLRYKEVQVVNILGTTFRLATIGLAIWWTRNYLWAVFLMALSSWLQGWMMGRVAANFLSGPMQPRQDDTESIAVVFRSQIVQALYYALEPQITLLLITVLGNVKRVAEIGALGRLTIVFSALNGVLGNLVAPRFARIRTRTLLLQRYAQTLSFVAIFGLTCVLVTFTLAHQILWLLGPTYAHLTGELVLMVGFTVFGLLTTAVGTLNVARAWNRGSWLCVPASLLIQLFLLRFLDLSSVRGVILFGWGALLASLGTGLLLSWRGFCETPYETDARID